MSQHDVSVKYLDLSSEIDKAYEVNKIIIECLFVNWESFIRIREDKIYTDALINMSNHHKALMYERNKSYGAGIMDWTTDLIDYLYDSQCPDFDEDDYFATFAA